MELQHEPPFTKRRCGPHYVWSRELDLAYAFAQREGLAFTLVTTPYQVAKLTGEDVRIIIYPHTTRSTGNRSLRVRDENSRNPARAEQVMSAMDALVPGFNTFSRRLSMKRWKREHAERGEA